MLSILPLTLRRPPGRPTKIRRKETDEPQTTERLSKRGVDMSQKTQSWCSRLSGCPNSATGYPKSTREYPSSAGGCPNSTTNCPTHQQYALTHQKRCCLKRKAFMQEETNHC
ncbi:hypothetical protein GOBAR_AA15164 [Gossypium barbadense]|uniref:Uncharacterized protein n=1 Tax=Gossypium barbadense TaxID=3634 RepID=A0A2P5XQ70_GOSBA|nr:hypothetical protein GOBAR_AA15164 [Gossypium barbadense]